MAGRNSRRDSLKNPHVREELRNLVPQDVFKGSFADFNLSNMTRLSGSSARGSLQLGKTSVIHKATPSLRTTAINASAAACSQSRAGSKPRESKVPSASRLPRSQSVSHKSAIPPVKSNLQKPTAGRMGSTTNLNTTWARSRSQETTIQTPAFTPSFRSRSKSPGASMSTSRRRGIHNETSDGIGRSIIIVKDKKHLVEMAKDVFEFLTEMDCQARPADWRDLVNPTKLSVAKYMSMIKFLASHIVSEAYFVKGEDEAEKVVELIKILKYPGALSKSHLKTPTAQHAWCGCFTFLAWLCTRTKALLYPPASQPTQFKDNVLQECAFESYLTLFPLHFRNELTSEYIGDMHEIEVTKTKDELQKEKEALKEELDQLNNNVDPSKEIKVSLQEESAVKESLNKKIHDIEIQCKKLSNVEHLELQQRNIEIDIKARKDELTRIKKRIEMQPLSKQEALNMINETSSLKNQLESIRHVNAALRNDCEARQMKLAAVQKEFYELCRTFGIVERYNENIRFLGLDNYTIPPNPFAPKELEDWMKEVSKTLRSCETRVSNMRKEITYSSSQKEKENQEYVQQMQALSHEANDLKAKTVAVEKYSVFIEREFEKKQADLQSQVDELNSELQEAEGALNEKQMKRDSFKKEMDLQKNKLLNLQGKVKEYEASLDTECGKYLKYVQEMQNYLQETVTKMAEAQREFYKEKFGVDIFMGVDLDPRSVADYCQKNDVPVPQ